MSETTIRWRPTTPGQPDEPVLFFSPDDTGNVQGGLIWVSGGRRIEGGWRNDYGKEQPTLYVPLREIAPEVS